MKGNTLEKKIQKLADLWLVGKIVNRIGIYGSKVAEGLSAFQRRSCLNYHALYKSMPDFPYIVGIAIATATPSMLQPWSQHG